MMSLATLGTGVTNTLPAFNGVTAQGSSAEINFNGMRYDHNNWLIDGGEVYDRGSGGRLDVAISPDALAEFQVLGSNYTPDYGIYSGGTVLMVLKGGTQKFHGALWEFNRNDAYDAGYYFFKQQNVPTPELRLNIFGGNVSGPVFIPKVYNTQRNKTFFFVNEEWRKFVQGANPSVTNTIPSRVLSHRWQPIELHTAQWKSVDRSGHRRPGKTGDLCVGRPGSRTAVSERRRCLHHSSQSARSQCSSVHGNRRDSQAEYGERHAVHFLTEAADRCTRGCGPNRSSFQ